MPLPLGSGTLTDGNLMTAASAYTAFVQPISDGIASLAGDAGWTTVPFQGTWGNYGTPYTVGGYRRNGPSVRLRGLIAGGATGSSPPIFVLPVAYRPVASVAFLVGAGPGVANVVINHEGLVYVSYYMNSGTNAYVSLENIRWATD